MEQTNKKLLSLEVDEDGRVFIREANLSYDEAIATCIIATEILMVGATASIMEAKATLPELDEKEIRASLYDRAVIAFSESMNRFFPERQELYEKTPEALLAEIDAKLAILDEADKKATT